MLTEASVFRPACGNFYGDSEGYFSKNCMPQCTIRICLAAKMKFKHALRLYLSANILHTLISLPELTLARHRRTFVLVRYVTC